MEASFTCTSMKALSIPLEQPTKGLQCLKPSLFLLVGLYQTNTAAEMVSGPGAAGNVSRKSYATSIRKFIFHGET